MDKIIAIYEGGYYTDEDNCDGIESNKYNYIFEKAKNLTWSDLKDDESLNGLLLDTEASVWEAEIWNPDTGDYRYACIDQGIFKDLNI